MYKSVLGAVLVCLLVLAGCATEQFRRVEADWELVTDPDMPVQIAGVSGGAVPDEAPVMDSLEILFSIESEESSSEYDIVIILFGKDGEVLKTYGFWKAVELADDSVKGVTACSCIDIGIERKLLDRYGSAALFVYRHSNSDGVTTYCDQAVLAGYFKENYPYADFDAFWKLLAGMHYTAI